MKVSIVMATYNRGYIIREALESALGQTYRDIEILVVDDGSTDDTCEVVSSLRDKRIRYLRHDHNRGCSAAYNTGITEAQGAVIAFLDSDDLWKPKMIETLASFLFRHPELDAAFCDVEIQRGVETIPSTTALMKVFPRLLENGEQNEHFVVDRHQMYLCLLEEVPIKTIAVMIRRKVFEKVGMFNELWPSGTDWDLFLRISQLFAYGYINVALAIQRVRPDSTFLSHQIEDKAFLLEVSLGEKAKLRGDAEGIRAVNRGIAAHCCNLAANYLASRQRKNAFVVYVQGFKETREPKMLMRAASVILPRRVRQLIKRSVN